MAPLFQPGMGDTIFIGSVNFGIAHVVMGDTSCNGISRQYFEFGYKVLVLVLMKIRYLLILSIDIWFVMVRPSFTNHISMESTDKLALKIGAFKFFKWSK